MLKFLKKSYRYIYAAVFYAEIEKAKMDSFLASAIEYSAWCLKEEIDKDILESVYKKAIDEEAVKWVASEYAKMLEESIISNLYFGHIPKIFVMPPAVEIEGQVRTITYRWGVGN